MQKQGVWGMQSPTKRNDKRLTQKNHLRQLEKKDAERYLDARRLFHEANDWRT